MELALIMNKVARGKLSPETALRLLKNQREENLGFARIDIERHHRRGIPEVIFAEGKTPQQIVKIIKVFKNHRQNVLCTRVTREMYRAVAKSYPRIVYHAAARMMTLGFVKRPAPAGQVAVVCAGTSDIPVAEEAALTAEWMGARVERIFDVGIAGLHRLLNHMNVLKSSRAVVVVAGMEGALPSVVGGLIDRPIVAVPTSVGYGTHLQGFSALLAMLNSCVPGIAVVNIDNGFGAGVTAALINRIGERE